MNDCRIKKQNKQTTLSLRSIVFSLTVATLCIVALVVLENHIVYSKVNELSEIKYSSIATEKVKSLKDWFQKGREFLNQQAIAIEVNENLNQDYLQAYFVKEIQELHDYYFLDLYFVSDNIQSQPQNGVISINKLNKNNQDYVNKSWYKKAIESDSIICYSIYRDNLTKKQIFTFAKRISIKNKIVGVICMDFLWEQLIDMVAEHDFGDVYSFLVDNNCGVVVHPYGEFFYNDGPKDMDSSNIAGYKTIKNALLSKQNYTTTKDYDSILRTFYFTKIDGFGWYIITAVDNGFITKENRILQKHISKLSILILLLFIGIEVVLRIITARKMSAEYKKVQNLAYHDQLTKLYNRQAYEEKLHEIQNNGFPENLVVIAFDLNGLKRVNDNMGHIKGDEYISGATDCLKEVFEEYGSIYRTGGDEFVALIQVVPSQLEKLLTKFENVTLNWEGSTIRQMSISYGCASHNEYPEASMEKLVTLADNIMYKSKAEYYKNSGFDRRQR